MFHPTGSRVAGAALHGVGLAWINEWPIERLLAERRLISGLDDGSPAVPGICLYYPSNRHMSAGCAHSSI